MGAGVYSSMQVLTFLAERAVRCDRVPLESSAAELAAINLSLQDLRDSMVVARKVAAAVDNQRCDVCEHASVRCCCTGAMRR